jgi:hypothetical protein
MGLSFSIAAGPRQHSHSRVQFPRDSWPYFTVSDSRLPDLRPRSPYFISPRNRVAQLYPQALGSIFVASYDSQGYGEDIRTCLHRDTKDTEETHRNLNNSHVLRRARTAFTSLSSRGENKTTEIKATSRSPSAQLTSARIRSVRPSVSSAQNIFWITLKAGGCD